MAAHSSLAQHLLRAASQYPAVAALLSNRQSWSFADLLADTRALAVQISNAHLPFTHAGTSLSLARYAYACSFENRPFWPVDRSNRPSAPSVTRSDAALIISTSGSEGQPQQVLLGNIQLDTAATAANKCLELGPGDLWLHCLPLYHIGGQAILWRCTSAAAGILLHDGFTASAVADDLQQHPVSHISLVPAMLAQLLEHQVKVPPSLRVALIGGAALSQPLYDKAVAAGWPLYPSYGMSETTAQLATFTPADGAWHPGLVGKPMPSHQIRIGTDGRVAIRGPQVMLGYLTGGGIDRDGWLSTGDLGSIDAQGQLTITGRADDMLISGGRNVHPLEVESCLAAFPGVRDVAVTGIPDPVWGDLIVALIVGNPEPSALATYAREHLPTAARPRKTIFLQCLPRNLTGKLERATLRRLAMESVT